MFIEFTSFFNFIIVILSLFYLFYFTKNRVNKSISDAKCFTLSELQ